MTAPSFAIVHEPGTDMHPPRWWLVVNGVRITGCYSEHEAREHLDTAEQAYEAGRAAALKCPAVERLIRCAECGMCAVESCEARLVVLP